MESIGRPRGCDHDEPFVLGIFRAAAKRENAESPRSLIDERAAINQSIEGTRSSGRSSFVEVIKLIEPSSAVHRRLSLRPRYRANVSCLFSHREKRPFFSEACSSRRNAASTTPIIFFIAGALNARSCYFATCLRLENSNFPRFSDIFACLRKFGLIGSGIPSNVRNERFIRIKNNGDRATLRFKLT